MQKNKNMSENKNFQFFEKKSHNSYSPIFDLFNIKKYICGKDLYNFKYKYLKKK